MRCTSCSAELDAGAVFCGECGTPVPVTPPTGGLVPWAASTCPTCGGVLDTGATFCGECGTPTTGAPFSPPDQSAVPTPNPHVPSVRLPSPPVDAAPVGPTAEQIAAARDRPRRPGGEMARRPLHFFWVADSSGSMAVDGKIQALNNAIREAIPHMQQVAADNPNAEVLVRALRFSDGAAWHIANATPVDQFRWADVTADGTTDMGRALTMLADQLKIPPMTDRALPPVIVMISDGQPTDDFNAGLKALLDQPWGRKAVRIAIAIGEDADQDVLQQFIGNANIRPLQANNPEALVNHIKWVSTAVLKSASSPASQGAVAGDMVTNVPVPMPMPVAAGPGVNDVW